MSVLSTIKKFVCSLCVTNIENQYRHIMCRNSRQFDYLGNITYTPHYSRSYRGNELEHMAALVRDLKNN